MVREFKEGMRLFGPLWKEIFTEEVFQELERSSQQTPDQFLLPVETWVKLLYELAAKYHHLRDHRMKLLGVMTPLYLGRVASFINRTRDLGSVEAEQVVEEQAQVFEELKPYLLGLWTDGTGAEPLEEALARQE